MLDWSTVGVARLVGDEGDEVLDAFSVRGRIREAASEPFRRALRGVAEREGWQIDCDISGNQLSVFGQGLFEVDAVELKERIVSLLKTCEERAEQQEAVKSQEVV